MNREYITEYRGYQIKPHKEHPASIVVATSGQGGKIPDVLNSMFTAKSLAKAAIDRYLENKPKEMSYGSQKVDKSGSK